MASDETNGKLDEEEIYDQGNPRRSARLRTCSGCHLPLKEHKFGDLSPYCSGVPAVKMQVLSPLSGTTSVKDNIKDESVDAKGVPDAFKAFTAGTNSRVNFDHKELDMHEHKLRLEMLHMQIDEREQSMRALEASFHMISHMLQRIIFVMLVIKQS